MKNRKLWIGLSLLLVIVIAAMIFLFSAQPAVESSELSAGLTRWILERMVPGFTGMTKAEQAGLVKMWGNALRKVAHFAEYAALGGALMAFIKLRMAPWSRRKAALAAWLGATLYAVTDELHQLFVSGRGPQFEDVCLDSLGALIGVLLAAAVFAGVRRFRKKEKAGREAAL